MDPVEEPATLQRLPNGRLARGPCAEHLLFTGGKWAPDTVKLGQGSSVEHSITGPPLVVDLDGTLFQTDLLLESFLALLKQMLQYVSVLQLWSMKGAAYLKQQIARPVFVGRQRPRIDPKSWRGQQRIWPGLLTTSRQEVHLAGKRIKTRIEAGQFALWFKEERGHIAQHDLFVDASDEAEAVQQTWGISRNVLGACEF